MTVCATQPEQMVAHNDASPVTRAASDSPFEIARRLRLLDRALEVEIGENNNSCVN